MSSSDMEPTVKVHHILLFTLMGVTAISALPLTYARWLLIPTIALVGYVIVNRHDAFRMLARIARILPLILVAAFSLSLAGGSDWTVVMERLGVALLKGILSLAAVFILLERIGYGGFLKALEKLGLPRSIVMSLVFLHRYGLLLQDEWHRMHTGMMSRTCRTLPPRRRLRILTNMVGVLFIRAYERAERVHCSMLSRGWQGDDVVALQEVVRHD